MEIILHFIMRILKNTTKNPRRISNAGVLNKWLRFSKTIIFYLCVSAVWLLLTPEESKPLSNLSALVIDLSKLILCINLIFFSQPYMVCMHKNMYNLSDVNPTLSKSPFVPSSGYQLFHLSSSFILYSWTLDRSCSLGVAGH